MNTNDLTVAIARHLESAGWHDAADYVRGDYITGKLSELMPSDLTDPAVVHANMLRGSIAKLTVDQVKHLYPDLCAYGQVQVLALEWKDDAPFFDDDPDSVIYSEAEGAGYTYVAEAVDCTLEEAKAACQAEFERRIIAALTPAPQVDAEHCGCGDKACLACFPAATPTAQEAVPVNQPQPNMSVAEAAKVVVEHEPCPKCASVNVEPYWWHRGQAWIIICQDCKHEEGREDAEYKAWQVWDDAALRALKGSDNG